MQKESSRWNAKLTTEQNLTAGPLTGVSTHSEETVPEEENPKPQVVPPGLRNEKTQKHQEVSSHLPRMTTLLRRPASKAPASWTTWLMFYGGRKRWSRRYHKSLYPNGCWSMSDLSIFLMFPASLEFLFCLLCSIEMFFFLVGCLLPSNTGTNVTLTQCIHIIKSQQINNWLFSLYWLR